MVDPDMLVACVVLALATYLIRLAGTATRERQRPESADQRLEQAIAVVLAAVGASSALYDGQDLADWTRGAGVLSGAAAAVMRLPLILVVLIAGATTAALRVVA